MSHSALFKLHNSPRTKHTQHTTKTLMHRCWYHDICGSAMICIILWQSVWNVSIINAIL